MESASPLRIHRNKSSNFKEDYLTEKKEAEEKRAGIQRFIATARQDLEAAKGESPQKQYQSSVKPIKEDIYHAEYELEQLAVRKKRGRVSSVGLAGSGDPSEAGGDPAFGGGVERCRGRPFLDPAGDRHASRQDGPGTRFLG